MKIKSIIITCLLLLPVLLFAQKVEDIGFKMFIITTEWAGSRVNSYVIIAENNEAIIIDPVDRLAVVNNTAQLVDPKTGQIKLFASPRDLQTYYKTDLLTGISTNIFTHEEYRAYDYYEPLLETPNIYNQVIDQNKLDVKYIVITHGHLDHFGALNSLKQKTGATVVMNVNDVRALDGKMLTAEEIAAGALAYPKDSSRIKGLTTPVDMFVTEGDKIKISDLEFSVMVLPGHSYGSIALYRDKSNVPTLFVGDVLMKLTVGRTNFTDGTGNNDELIKSLERLKTLPDNAIVYSGHGDSSTIGFERMYNRFLNIDK